MQTVTPCEQHNNTSFRTTGGDASCATTEFNNGANIDAFKMHIQNKNAELLKAQEEAARREEADRRARQASVDLGINCNTDGNNAAASTAKTPANIMNIKKTSQGEVVPQVIQFTVCGTPSELEEMDPLIQTKSNLEWTQLYNDESRVSKPHSPWRSMYAKNGIMSHFMKMNKKGFTTEHSQPAISTHLEGPVKSLYKETINSKVVLRATIGLNVTNNSPFTIGIFNINGKVSRMPENPLYQDRVNSIVKAFDRHMSTHGGNTTISLMKIVQPHSNITFEDDVIFRASDVVSDDLKETSSKVSTEDLRCWIGVDYDDMEKSVLNMRAALHCRPEQQVALITAQSPLCRFIRTNWQDIMLSHYGSSNVSQNSQNVKNEQWTMSAGQVYETDPEGYAALSAEDLAKEYHVWPLSTWIVQTALEMAKITIDTLPYEELTNQQIYVARLDANTWTASTGNVNANMMESYSHEKIMINFQAESWFEIVTSATRVCSNS